MMNNNLEIGKSSPEHYDYLIVDYHSSYPHYNKPISIVNKKNQVILLPDLSRSVQNSTKLSRVIPKMHF